MVGRAWEETRAAKAEMTRVREKSILLVLVVDFKKVGLLLRIWFYVEIVDGVRKRRKKLSGAIELHMCSIES